MASKLHPPLLARALRCFLLVCTLAFAAGPAAAQETMWTPDDAQLLETAQASLRGGSARTALTSFDDLLTRYPTSVDLHRLRGFALMALERESEARAAFSNALARGGLSTDVLGALLQLDYAAERIPAVLASSRLLVLLEPENEEWTFLHADLLLQNGSFAAAEVIYTGLLERDMVRPELYERLGRTAYAAGRRTEAAELFETAYYLGSSDPQLPESLGRLWRELGDGDRADLWVERGAIPADRAGAEPGLALRTAQNAYLQGDDPRADRLAAELVEGGESVPQDVRAGAASLRGRVARRAGDDAALGHFRSALELGLEDPDLWVIVGDAAGAEGRPDEALEWLGKAWDAGRRDAAVLSRLVEAALDAGRPEASDRFLVDHLEREGLDDVAQRLVERRARADP